MKNPNNWRRFSPQLLGSVEKIKKFDVKATRQKVVLSGSAWGFREIGERGVVPPPKNSGYLGLLWERGGGGVPLEMRGWRRSPENSGYSGSDCCAKILHLLTFLQP